MKIPYICSLFRSYLLLLLLVFGLSFQVFGQNVLIEEEKAKLQDASDIAPNQVIIWNVLQARSYKDGQFVIASVRLSTKNNFTIYKDKLTFSSPAGAIVSKTILPKTTTQFDPISRQDVEVFTSGEFEIGFSLPFQWQEEEFPIDIRYVGCTQVICLFPYTEHLSIKIFPDANPLNPLWLEAPEDHASSEKPKLQPINIEKSEKNPQLSSLQMFEQKLHSQLQLEHSFLLILLISLLGGLLTNITPCVYPMIPITIRILGHYAQNTTRAACAYAFGIFITYSVLGIFAALTGAFFGSMMQNTYFNLFFALVMGFLALSMLGFGNFAGMQKFGHNLSQGKKGLKGAFIMGLGAGFVAAPCTGPILAALMGLAASGLSLMQTVLMMSTYSLGFALPYVVLGSSTKIFHTIKLGMRPQVLVKILFAGMMFALVFYYLRVPFYAAFKSWPWNETLKYALPVLIPALLVALISKKSLEYKTFLVIPAFLIGLCTFSYVQILIEEATHISRNELTWHKSEQQLFSEAKKNNSPILIDMWAEWCESCKKMDATTFSDPLVINYMKDKKWVLGKYDLTESNDWTDRIQETYRLQGLPALIIIADPHKPEEFHMISGMVLSEQLLTQLKTHTGE